MASTQDTDQGMAASRVVEAIEALWRAIQREHPEVPNVVVTFGAGSIGAARGTLNLGHFAASRWVAGETVVHELFIGGEGLVQGAVEVTGTLLHEAAHALAHARGLTGGPWARPETVPPLTPTCQLSGWSSLEAACPSGRP